MVVQHNLAGNERQQNVKQSQQEQQSKIHRETYLLVTELTVQQMMQQD